MRRFTVAQLNDDLQAPIVERSRLWLAGGGYGVLHSRIEQDDGLSAFPGRRFGGRGQIRPWSWPVEHPAASRAEATAMEGTIDFFIVIMFEC